MRVSVALLAVIVVVAGCGLPGRSVGPSTDPTGSPAPAASVPSSPPTPDATPDATDATATPGATSAAVAGPIGGTWRVRKVLSPGHRSALVDGTVFGEQAFVVRPGCDDEPCPTIEVAVTPLARARPVETTVLARDGDVYASAPQPGNEAPCLSPDGERIPGGATVSSTLRLWLATIRPAGSAVATTVLAGVVELALTPTAIGTAAGCGPTVAAYDLTGRREAVAIRTPAPPRSTAGPITGGRDLVALPRIAVKVDGASVDYFDIEGATAGDLLEALADGGVQACGAINYEWYEGDARPVACAVTRFVDFEGALEERVDGDGDCTIADADVAARFTIHFPSWVAPRRVPERLLSWWRQVVDFIRDHEAGHVRIGRDHIRDLNADLIGVACGDAGAMIRHFARRLNAAQADFDRREYALPWPEPPAGF